MEKIKTVEEYQQLASRTCPDLGTGELNLRHMQMGIITEVAETLDVIKKFVAYGKPLDIVNIGEEIADTAWYKANEARMEGIVWKQEEFDKYCSELDKFVLSKELEAVSADNVDGFLATLLPVNYGQTEGFAALKDLAILNLVATFYGLDMFQLLTNNINKLKVRYPDKFTNEAALNRDLVAERAELEK